MRVLGPALMHAPEEKLQVLLDIEEALPVDAIRGTAETSGITFFIYSVDGSSCAIGEPKFVVWVVTPKGEIHMQTLQGVATVPGWNNPWRESVSITRLGFPMLARQPPVSLTAPLSIPTHGGAWSNREQVCVFALPVVVSFQLRCPRWVHGGSGPADYGLTISANLLFSSELPQSVHPAKSEDLHTIAHTPAIHQYGRQEHCTLHTQEWPIRVSVCVFTCTLHMQCMSTDLDG